MKIEASTVLVICAHPDDEVLGCGATIAKLVRQGSAISVVFLADGVTSRDMAALGNGELDARQAMARRAAKILGVAETHFLDFPDNRLDTVGLLDLAQAIENVTGFERPDILFTHSPSDLNVDHRKCAAAAMTAFRPNETSKPAMILGFEVPSSSEWSTDALHGSFTPNLFISVDKEIDVKVEAMGAYASEMREPPHPRSEAYVRALATVRGGAAGVVAAEAFQLLRGVL